MHRRHNVNVGLHAPAEETTIVLASAHGKRQARDLRRTRVNFQTGKVVLQNELRNLALTIAALLIHGEQQIERVHQNMARTARRVAQRYFLGPVYANEVFMFGIGLNIVFHALTQTALRVVQHPQTPKRILHHVAHNPFGREQLRCYRQRVGGRLRLRLEEVVFGLRIIILVHPTQNFNVSEPVLFRNVFNHGLRHAVARHKPVGQKQL